MKEEKIIALAALGGLAWLLYTRSQGLTLAGQPANVMLDPARSQLSLVTPSYSTSTAATNPNNLAVALSSLVNKFLSSIARPSASGNGPAIGSTTISGIAPGTTGAPASYSGVASIGSALPTPDPSLLDADPYWSWDFSFDTMPTIPNYAALGWTLPADANVIPPPPGS